MPQQPLPLKDIKPLVEVPDHSVWLLAALVAAAVALIALIVLYLLRRRRARVDRKRAEALRRLDAINWDDTKQAVYDFSFLGHFVTSPKSEMAFAQIVEELEAYKYRKTVPELGAELKTRMQAFIREVHRG